MAGEHVNIIDWHIHPFRADRWFEIWLPAAERMLAFGATRWSLVRSVDDPLLFRQISTWRDPDDFERYWASDEVSAIREQAMNFFNKPLVPSWHTFVAGEPGEVPAEQISREYSRGGA
jgi:quinol monooxygenase YgiN